MEVINQVAQPVLLLVLPILAAAATAWLVKAWQVKSLELNQQQYTTLRWLVSTGIWAAEQAWQSGLIPKELREDYVVNFVQAQADKYNIAIDVKELVKMIKAAVGEELNKGKYVIDAKTPA